MANKTYNPETITPEEFILWLETLSSVEVSLFKGLFKLLSERLDAKSAALFARDILEGSTEPCDDPSCEACHPVTVTKTSIVH